MQRVHVGTVGEIAQRGRCRGGGRFTRARTEETPVPVDGETDILARALEGLEVLVDVHQVLVGASGVEDQVDLRGGHLGENCDGLGAREGR